MTKPSFWQLLPIFALTLIASPAALSDTVSPHAVETTKFTVEDAEISKAFYEDMLGMRELRRFVAEGNLVEPFMGWSEDSRIGLLDFVKK